MLLPESVEGGGANLVLVATTLQSKYTAFNVMRAHQSAKAVQVSPTSLYARYYSLNSNAYKLEQIGIQLRRGQPTVVMARLKLQLNHIYRES